MLIANGLNCDSVRTIAAIVCGATKEHIQQLMQQSPYQPPPQVASFTAPALVGRSE